MFNLFLLLITLVTVLHNEVRNVGYKLRFCTTCRSIKLTQNYQSLDTSGQR